MLACRESFPVVKFKFTGIFPQKITARLVIQAPRPGGKTNSHPASRDALGPTAREHRGHRQELSRRHLPASRSAIHKDLLTAPPMQGPETCLGQIPIKSLIFPVCALTFLEYPSVIRCHWSIAFQKIELPQNEHSPQQAAGYLTLAIQGPLTRASTALIPLSVFLVRAHSAPPWPNLLSPLLFQGSSHPTNIVLPIAPFFPIVLAVTLLALLCSYISARSSRALVLDALRIASVRDPYRIPIPPSRSHIVPLSLLSSPPIPSVLSFLSMPSDILPASLRDNVSPTHNAILALIRLFPPSLPSSFLKSQRPRSKLRGITKLNPRVPSCDRLCIGVGALEGQRLWAARRPRHSAREAESAPPMRNSSLRLTLPAHA